MQAMKFRKAVSLTLALLTVIAFWPPLSQSKAIADSRPAEDRGAMGLGQAIKRLGVVASVLHTGAHPDDEDSSLLAYLARGRQARTAYLSLTRGDGGQNLIGPELYESLGVIRTEELLAARRLDGAGQFFTRAYDFGFSKSRAEALSKWDRNEVLADMVRVIRTFRPMVIVSAWSGTPNDGHGHHQAAGLLTVEAYRAAADPARFPEQIKEGLRPWRTRKLYVRSSEFAQQGEQPQIRLSTLSINTGQYDPLLGRGYSELATQGRNQHRTQDQDAVERRGPRFSRLRLIESEAGPAKEEKDIFDGIDTSIQSIAQYAGGAAARLAEPLADAQRVALEARKRFNPLSPSDLVSFIASGLKSIRDARALLSQSGVGGEEFYNTDFLLKQKEEDFADALAKSAGVVVDCLADDEIVVPGQEFSVSVESYAPNSRALPAVSLSLPRGWTATEKRKSNSVVDGRAISHVEFKVTAALDAEPTESYWLKNPRKGDMFSPGNGGTGIEPVAPPPVVATVEFEIYTLKVAVAERAQYRYAGKAQGEVRHDLKVAPAISVNASPGVLIFPASSTQIKREVTVTLTNNLKSGASGTVRLENLTGWQVTPAVAQFDLKREGERAGFVFTVTIPANAPESRREVTAIATANGQEFRRGYEIVSYPHIEPRLVFNDSRTEAQVIDARLAPGLKVGYIEGAGDDFANALKRLGADVEIIEPRVLASGDLSRFDTIVLGVRVYEVRPDVIANNARLLDYVRDGGALIVQYNKTDYEEGSYAPYPTSRRQNQNGEARGRGNREARLVYLDEKTVTQALGGVSAPGLKVGFVGSKDDGLLKASENPQLKMTLIGESELAAAKLDDFDVIVIGAGAGESRPDLGANNQRLIDYARRKIVIVAYSTEQFFNGNFPTYPKIDSKPYRVTDERAAVSILDPAHPLFNFPNKISARDFEGWVSERGAYFLSDWDPQYKALLSSRDAGEEPKQGGQLIASFGKGYYIYTAYAWFRQLPKGVPGAYRLIANMVSFPKSQRK